MLTFSDFAVNWLLVLLSYGVSYVFGFVDNFLLHSLICFSKRISLIDVKKVRKNSANNICATLASCFACACFAQVLFVRVLRMLLSSEKKITTKSNIAYKIVNLSKM